MPGQWDRAKEILALALERSPQERSGFVHQACGDDDELRVEVESLLLYHDKADSLLESSSAAQLLAFQPASLAGKSIGSYRIVREIGQGGMAVVYLGERDDQHFRKRVAIKMVRGIHTEEILHRFRNERQTLAALDHPNIVKLIDGGSTDDALPYLVMDYVEGEPIDKFCDARQLSISARLRLFLDVCGAVQYAHQNLVIHRDLKPGNILITKDGIPRLLDFGIAKLLNPEFLLTPLVTQTNWRPMTLEYASPEQVQGHAVTKASDIYSLGVLLYELLTGHRPYSAAGRSRLEIERLICEEEPQRPSAVVSTPQRVSQARGVEPAELRRRLRGDLDNIVMKALRKDPERRYSSAEEFGEDIERHLSDMPVRARNSTFAYRGGRFLRRHKESFATALVMFALVAGIGLWEVRGILRKSPADQRSNTVRLRVRPSLAVLGFKNLSGRPETVWVSTAIAEMLTNQLAAGEELRIVPGETVARTKLDLSLTDSESIPASALERVRENLGSGLVALGSYLDTGRDGEGQIRFDMRLEDTATGQTIATVSEIGSEAQLQDLASRTGTRLRERLGLSKVSETESQGVTASFPSNAEAMRVYSLGLSKLRAFESLAARDFLVRAVKADGSYPLAHSALATAWAALGYDANARQEAKLGLDADGKLSREDRLLVEARYYETVKQWPKAIEAYEVLVSFFPDNPDYALYLAGAQSSGGKGKDALDTLAALVRTSAEAENDPRIDLAISLAASSSGDSKLRRDAAERAALKANRQGARLLVARARNQECRALANLGEYEKAKSVCEEGRRIFTEAGDRGGLARMLHNTAEVPLNQGDFISAAKLYEQALAIMREIDDQQGMGSELVNLGLISVKRGDFATAHRLYTESLRSYQQAGDKNGMAAVTGNTGNLLRAEGKLPEALLHYRKTQALSDEVGNRGSVALCLSAIGQVMADEGDLSGAYEMYQQAAAIQQEMGEKSNYATSLVGMGQVFLQQAEMDRAQNVLDEALSIQRGLGEKGGVAETELALGELACELGRPNQAEKLAQSARKEFRDQNQPDKQISAAALLARAQLLEGNTKEAFETIAEALKLAQQSPNVTVRLRFSLDRARVLAASKDTTGAERIAQTVVAQTAGRLFLLHLDAALVLGEIQIKGNNAAAGRKRLEQLVTTARANRFELIARKATARSVESAENGLH